MGTPDGVYETTYETTQAARTKYCRLGIDFSRVL